MDERDQLLLGRSGAGQPLVELGEPVLGRRQERSDDHRLLVGEVVGEDAGGEAALAGDVAHGRGLEAVSDDHAAGGLAHLAPAALGALGSPTGARRSQERPQRLARGRRSPRRCRPRRRARRGGGWRRRSGCARRASRRRPRRRPARPASWPAPDVISAIGDPGRGPRPGPRGGRGATAGPARSARSRTASTPQPVGHRDLGGDGRHRRDERVQRLAGRGADVDRGTDEAGDDVRGGARDASRRRW